MTGKMDLVSWAQTNNMERYYFHDWNDIIVNIGTISDYNRFLVTTGMSSKVFSRSPNDLDIVYKGHRLLNQSRPTVMDHV